MNIRRSGSSNRFAGLGFLVASLALSLLLAACSVDDGEPGEASPNGDGAAQTTASTDDLDGSRGTTAPADQGLDQDGGGSEDPAPDARDRPATTAFRVSPATWSECDNGLQCTTVQVPIDRADPDGETIGIAMVRVPAPTLDANGHRPSIFVNPGGPGGSGVGYVRNGFRLDETTMAAYHLVGFDPRGVGDSDALDCEPDLTVDLRPDFSPDSAEEAEALDAEARSLADRCAATDIDLLPHIGTDAVAADLDLLRQSVGDEQLHYMGLSYGTVIGLRYAERHPGLVGHMVLDGVVDPSFTLADLLRQQAGEFERAFMTLDDACASVLTCPSGGVAAAYDELMVDLERTGPRQGVGNAELQVATLISMYSERLWPRYAEALISAQREDMGPIEQLHDLYVGGASFAAYLAVSCVDSPSPTGGRDWDQLAAELTELAPRFGAALANEVRSCAYWPVEATGRPASVAAAGSEPILVLSTTGDPATPLVNAANVAADLSSAGLVIEEDEGHTAYGRSFCVAEIVSAYFESGSVPDEVHRC